MASPKDFLTGSAPEGASYAGPMIGFQLGDRLAQLPQQYRQAQLQNAFPNGLDEFKGPNGQYDISGIVNRLSKLGGAETAAQLLPTLLKSQFANQPDPLAAPTNDNTPPPVRPTNPAASGPSNITGEFRQQPQRPLVGMSPARTADAGGGFAGRFNPVYQQQRGTSEDEAPPQYGTEFTPGRGDRYAQSPGGGAPGQELVPPTWAPNARRLGYDESPTGYARYLEARARQEATFDPARAKPYEDEAAAVRASIAKGTEQIRGSQLPTEAQRNLQSGATQRGEELKGEIERGGKTYAALNARDQTFQTDLKPALDVSKSILNDPRAYTGIGAERKLDFNRVKAIWGDNSAAVLQEALKKVTATSVNQQTNQLRFELQEAGGQASKIFQGQYELMREAAPRMETTLGGNRFLVEYQTRVGELGSEIAGRARDYVAAHGHLDSGFDRQAAAYLKSHPIFSKEELSDPTLIAAPSIPPALAKNHAGIVAWGQQMGLQRGDVMRDSKGEYRTMP